MTIFPGYEVALKTGTTNDYRDAWAIGYTPNVVVGVWAGNSNNEQMHSRGSSILAAVPMWSNFMREALGTGKFAKTPFTRPQEMTAAEKPMVGGEILKDGQIHTILYWVKKDDPNGPIPENPYADPQFYNWEQSVLEWAKKNIPNFESDFNKKERASFEEEILESRDFSISFRSPRNGFFVDSPIIVRAAVRASYGLSGIRLYLNGDLIHSMGLNDTDSYSYIHIITDKLKDQNELKLEMIDGRGDKYSRSVIVFRKR